jgi:DNA repair protein RadC
MADNKKLSIKNWALEDRPREKLLAKGISSLSDSELIAILIGSGNKDESAVELSMKILNKVNNNLNELGKLSVKELETNKGIGEAKAISIIAALELGKRRKLADIINKKKIEGSKDVFELFQPILGDLPYEEFWILLLNRSNKIIDKYKISQGGVSGTIIDMRLILKNAIEKLASSIILCHNHPSENMKPSEPDIKITKKLKEAAKIMDISVIDHVIITDSSYYSFADEGII